jgi:phospholipid N-methyltransferase
MTHSRLVFLKEFLNSFQTTGAVAPSGRHLARAMVQPLLEIPGERRILEAGPGTGVFSDQIIRALRPGDELILCEVNSTFAEYLKRRLNEDPGWSPRGSQIRVECSDIREFFAPGRFDFIVSGLPLNNFSPDLVHELLGGFVESLKPHGVHTFFEYQAVRSWRIRFGAKETRLRMTGIQKSIDSAIKNSTVARKSVFLNMPPAYAYEVRPHNKV